MISKSCLKENLNISNIYKLHKYNKLFLKNNPTYFKPDGFVCFVGSQGSGKTLSAVNYVSNLLKSYPHSILVTNILLKDYPPDNVRCFLFKESSDLTKYKNGINGVIFLIDEIHLYYGSQKGNNNLDPAVLQQICQQRKQRIHIVSTTQYYAQLNIALRRHFDSVILCKSYLFNYLQVNSLINKDSIKNEDGSTQTIEGQVKAKFFWFRNPLMFEKYDTYQIIDNNNLNVGIERSDFNV